MLSNKAATIDHSKFDEKEFHVNVQKARRLIQAAREERPGAFYFTGTPRDVVAILARLAARGGVVTGLRLREFMEKNRKEALPSCKQADVLRAFQGYQNQLRRAGVLN